MKTPAPGSRKLESSLVIGYCWNIEHSQQGKKTAVRVMTLLNTFWRISHSH